MNREPNRTLQMMMNAIGHSLSDLSSSNAGDDGDDVDEEKTALGQQREDDKPAWVMGIINKTVQQCIEMFQQKSMQLDELTQAGWKDTANYCPEYNKMHTTSELRVLAVLQPQTDDDAVAPEHTECGELMACLDIAPRISQMLQGTCQPGSSEIRLDSGKPQSNMSISDSAPDVKPDLYLIPNAKRVEVVRFYNFI
jgi:hypothetical protein